MLLLFFLFINLIPLVGLICMGGARGGRDGEAIVYVTYLAIRVFGGTVVSLVAHIEKGFNLYDDLTEEEAEEGMDSSMLFYLRVFFLFTSIAFTIYLSISCICMCAIGGLDGNNMRNNLEVRRRFRRVPLSNLLFQANAECPICMVEFRQNQRVV